MLGGTNEQAAERFAAKTGRIITGWDPSIPIDPRIIDPAKAKAMDFELAMALESGAIDDDTARGLAHQIVRPAKPASKGKPAVPERLESIYQMHREQQAIREDAEAVLRATAREIDDARRLGNKAELAKAKIANRDAGVAQNKIRQDALDEAKADILKDQGFEKPPVPSKSVVNQILRTNLFYQGLIRESYMLNPFRVIAAGSLDMGGNAYFELITGNFQAAKATLDVRQTVSMAKQTLAHEPLTHPTIDLLDKLGIPMEAGLVDDLTRDLHDVSKPTNWAQLGQKVGGKVGRVAAETQASTHGRAWRHMIDMNARLNVHGDVVSRTVKAQRTEMYKQFRGAFGDDVAQGIIDDLGRNADFSAPTLNNVLREHGIADHAAIARNYREMLAEASGLGKKEVNRTHFRMQTTKADEAARHVMLFHFWQSRAMVFYPRTVLSNPYLMYNHVQVWERLKEEAERDGRSGMFAPLTGWFEWQAGPGWFFQFDPISYLIPFTMYRDAMTDYAGESFFDEWSRKFGVFVNPAITMAASAMGFSEQYPSLLGSLQTRNVVRAVLNWDKAHGNWLNRENYVADDWITKAEQKAVNGVNNLLNSIAPGVFNDTEPYDITRSDTIIIQDLIIAQAEEDFGMSYAEMQQNPDQKYYEEVIKATMAVIFGYPNERAEAAQAEWATWDQGVQVVVKAFVPGYVPVRSTISEDRKDLNKTTYGMPYDQMTPEQINAQAISQTINAGSPQAVDLNSANNRLQALGTERQQQLYSGWNALVYDTFDNLAYEEIGGKVYYGYDINKMTTDERKDLADQWVLDYMGTNELATYRDERDVVIGSNDNLAAYKEYTKAAATYNDGAKETKRVNPTTRQIETVVSGGIRDFRLALEADAESEFSQAIKERRAQLQADGFEGQDLEVQLDFWANSESGYNAAMGYKDKAGDKDPLPAYSGSDAAPVWPGQEDQASAGGSSGTASSGGKDKAKDEPKMPEYQVNLIKEYEGYEAALTAFEDQYGSIGDYTSPMGQRLIAKNMPEISNTLRKYYEWAGVEAQAGRAYDMDTYIAKLDREYAERHPEDE